jgi:hypothetical protein
MIWNRLFHSKRSKSAARSTKARKVEFRLEVLEDRTVPSCVGFRTQTQGYWGGPGGAAYLAANLAGAFPSGATLGQLSGNSATWTSASAIGSFLPAGGPAAALGAGNVTNPSSTAAGVLGGQALTLVLNVGFDYYDASFAAATENLGDLTYVDTMTPELGEPTAEVFNGMTVVSILGKVNEFLATGSTTVGTTTLTGASGALIVNAVCDNINENFDNGTVDNGYLRCCDNTITIGTIAQTPAPLPGSPADGVPGEELTYSVDFTYTDVGGGQTYTATWDWGDNTTSTGDVTDNLDGTGSVSKVHVYSAYGTYHITVTITGSECGEATSEPKTVVIGPVAILSPIFCAGGTPGPAIVVGGTSLADFIQLTHDSNSYNIKIDVGRDGIPDYNVDIPEGTPVIGRIVIHGNDGDDKINVASNGVDRHCIHGGDGNDDISITGQSGASLVLGGSGNDSITGGSSRDVIIGGTGSDVLEGKGGEDLVITGTTDFDDDDEALGDIMDVWLGGGLASARRTTLMSAPYNLNTTTVHDDGVADTIKANKNDNDWILYNYAGTGPLDIVLGNISGNLTDDIN